MNRSVLLAALIAFAALSTAPSAQAPRPASPFAADTFAGLKARSIGPAMTSGRVMTIAVDPSNQAVIYIGAASGGVWKTVNGGASWQPVFDSQGSFSIGWIALDEKRPNVVWVGTGERNSQRSVSYGDGVYKSEDGGRSWTNVGLQNSEHIGRIVIDPKDSDIVYVAAQGPLWAAGGDRGLYKTTDGGKTWNQVLKISENTGVSDVVLDPRNPEIVIATAYQRRRHFYTLIDGGPEAAIHRSTDGGKTWKKVNTGLPNEELGRIGLAISPVNPDIVYANVEAANGKGGILPLRGQRHHVAEADGLQRRRDVLRRYLRRSGERRSRLHPRRLLPGFRRRRQDDARARPAIHARRQSHHLGRSGEHQPPARRQRRRTLPFVRSRRHLDVLREPAARAVLRRGRDNAAPFYNVYGGLQDNNSLGGPSRTRSEHGILNQDWFVTQGGDGFVVASSIPKIPTPSTPSCSTACIVRVDKRTGERVGIQPQEDKGAPPARWNWDSPFIISPHSHTTLYMASQYLHRSDDRGNSLEDCFAGSDAADRSQLAAGDGQALGARRGGEKYVHGALRQHLGDRREPEEERAALHRLRRWACPCERR